MKNSEIPVPEQERIISLDIMRGFAILGIFLVNMLSFHSPLLYFDPFEWWIEPADRSTYVLIDILVQASFYPLFALLFGYGLVILRERTMIKGLSFRVIAVRRFSLLLVIGLLHAFFIWHGDILVNYALFGFLFLPFIRMNGKNLILTGILMYIIPNLLLTILLIVTVLFVPGGDSSPFDAAQAEASLQVYHSGSFSEITAQRIKDWYLVNNLASLPIMLISIFPLFLIGGGAAKLKWLEEPGKHAKMLLRIVIISLCAGLLIKLLPYLWDRNLAVEFMQDIFGGPLLAVGYGLAIAISVSKGHVQKLLIHLSYVGKLSLSNYLVQSVLSTLLFYSYGLGLYGEISVFTGTLFVFFIFICQIIISRFWVRRFYYGPAEWLWRSFTYFRLPKWKRE